MSTRVDRVEFTVDVRPGDGRLNGRAVLQKRGNRRTIGKSPAYKAYMGEVSLECSRVRSSVARFDEGPLGVSITFYVEAMRDGWPDLDVDASIKATLDGMTRGGLIDDDARVMECHARKRFDPRRPRVAVLLYRLPISA